MKPVTDLIAQFICETKLEEIPGDVIERAKFHILDAIGALCAGSMEKVANIITEYIASLGCKRESTLIMQGLKTSAQYAAFGNGIIAHALDYDDYEWPSMAHPSVVVLPAVMALGEKVRAAGSSCLEAYLVGLEVISKVGSGMNPNHYDKGWHSTGTLGVLGAAAASAKLLGHDSEKVRTALGIAASTASGLRGNFGTMTKPFHAGHASKNGVESALLAALGFTADKTILERELGFCSLFTEGGDWDAEKIVGHLGNPFSILSPGIGIKPYPSCAATHSVLDGVFHLVNKHAIRAEDVGGVECGIFYLYPHMLIHAEPRTSLEGKFSLEFCVALALSEREVSLNKFTDEKVNDPKIRKLMKNVKKAVTEEVGTRGTTYPGAIVRIELKDGRSFTEKVLARKGSPANPLSPDDVVQKFVDNASLVLAKDKVDELLEKIMRMDELKDGTDIMQCLNPKGRKK